MAFIFGLPAIVKILLIFALIMVLVRFNTNMGVALLISSLVTGLWFELPLLDILKRMFESTYEQGTLSFIVLVIMILTISGIMNRSGQLERIVGIISHVSGNIKISLMILPSLVGILPMPGGAIFSAPMVGVALKDHDMVTPEEKTIINHWFRHVWEYWLPTYPGVLLAMELSGVPLSRFIILLMPMSVVAISVGYVLLLRKMKIAAYERDQHLQLSDISKLLFEIAPILIVVFGMMFLSIPWHFAGLTKSTHRFIKYGPLLIGLFGSVGWLLVVTRNAKEKFIRALFDKNVITMTVLVFGIMAFRVILETSGAVVQMSDELQSYHVPLVAVVMFLPFISGLVTGVSVGYAGAAFPLIMGLISQQGLESHLYSYTFLAVCFGYAGMMLSPVHLCYIMTRDYFSATLGGSYRIFLPGKLIEMAGGLAIFCLYYYYFNI